MQNKTLISEILHYFLGATITFVCLVVTVILIMVSLTGCTTKYQDKIVEVYKAVPEKCEFILPPRPEIRTDTIQEIAGTYTLLANDSIELRKQIKTIPCLIVSENNETIKIENNTTN